MKKLTAIKEFDTMCDLPGGCNILAAGKNTPIWNENMQSVSIAMQYYNQAEQAAYPLILQDVVGDKATHDNLI